MSFQVLLFYKYVTIQDPKAFADWFRVRAEELSLTGRALIAEEGINATVEGALEKTNQFIQDLRTHVFLSDLKIKTSAGNGKSFPGLSVRIRKEIVGTPFSLTDADPRVRTASHLPPEKLHEMYANNEDFVVVDMRNSYEFASGHFKGSIDPGMRNSRDLEQAIIKLEPYKNKKIVTVCTGGIRCEKMSAYLLSHGFTDVHQLEDGIHAYMEKYPGQDFQGTLYTFDDRVVMDFTANRDIVGKCHTCGVKTERYVNCANDECHLHMLACETCVPSEKQAVCSPSCQAQAFLLNSKKRLKRSLFPLKKDLVRFKRHLKKRYFRTAWRIRLWRQARDASKLASKQN